MDWIEEVSWEDDRGSCGSRTGRRGGPPRSGGGGTDFCGAARRSRRGPVKIGGTALLDARPWRSSCLEFCESAYPSQTVQPGCPADARLREPGSRPQGPHWRGQVASEPGMPRRLPTDKKKGHPAVRPDTLSLPSGGAIAVQNGGRSSPLAVRLAGSFARAGAVVVAAGVSASLAGLASRTMCNGMRASRSRSARFA